MCFQNAVFSGEQEKEFNYLCEDGIEKYVPHGYHLSSLGKPHIGDPGDGLSFSLSHS